ncbi:hypothetical protein HPB48_001570 [Haemaphysalis longicornis]|uniref:Dimethylargininase n=1 Tax=Haemaphysalis longicornis TaxID=44386 RepID=A0A9J6FH30_HAELO|nr:hypothetical protein HPB48_001570 [Haemaphysalis longicornis]
MHIRGIILLYFINTKVNFISTGHTVQEKPNCLVFVVCKIVFGFSNSSLQRTNTKYTFSVVFQLDIIRATIKKELGITVIDIRDPKAVIEGGNVLFTGREFFVGISPRTNEAGARALAATFPEYPVTPIKLPKRNHLKALLSMAGPDVICLSDSPEAQAVKRQVEREATFQYQTVTLPEERAAGCLYINGRLLHRHEFPAANQVN